MKFHSTGGGSIIGIKEPAVSGISVNKQGPILQSFGGAGNSGIPIAPFVFNNVPQNAIFDIFFVEQWITVSPVADPTFTPAMITINDGIEDIIQIPAAFTFGGDGFTSFTLPTLSSAPATLTFTPNDPLATNAIVVVHMSIGGIS